MGSIGNHPEFSCPGYDCPRSTFSLVVIIGEMGINAADFKRLGFLAGVQDKSKKDYGINYFHNSSQKSFLIVDQIYP
jgi:hypothetical protein